MQLQHVVGHHFADLVHHEGCSHHHHDATPVTWPAEDDLVRADGDCPLCDWTSVPVLSAEVFALADVLPDWPFSPSLGEVQNGWTGPVCAPGIGWRGPPVRSLL